MIRAFVPIKSWILRYLAIEIPWNPNLCCLKSPSSPLARRIRLCTRPCMATRWRLATRGRLAVWPHEHWVGRLADPLNIWLADPSSSSSSSSHFLGTECSNIFQAICMPNQRTTWANCSQPGFGDGHFAPFSQPSRRGTHCLTKLA